MPGLCYIDRHMNGDIQHIFLTPPITEVTINSVFLSPEFSIRNGDVLFIEEITVCRGGSILPCFMR